jgi:uncharacterized integral membrane protein
VAKYKLVGAAILALIAVIVILQNSLEITTRILFFSITIPLSVLLLGTLLIGFALGVIITMLAERGQRKKNR